MPISSFRLVGLASLASFTVMGAGLAACGGSGGAAPTSDGGGDVTVGDSGGTTDSASEAFADGSSSESGPEAGEDGAAPGCDGSASLPPDAGVPPPHICKFPDGGTDFPLFDKCCVTTEDCALGIYMYSCCGDTFAMGFNKSQQSAFQAVAAQWQCAACGCASGGQLTEDGKKGGGDAGVKCDNGWCMTYAQ